MKRHQWGRAQLINFLHVHHFLGSARFWSTTQNQRLHEKSIWRGLPLATGVQEMRYAEAIMHRKLLEWFEHEEEFSHWIHAQGISHTQTCENSWNPVTNLMVTMVVVKYFLFANAMTLFGIVRFSVIRFRIHLCDVLLTPSQPQGQRLGDS